MSARTVQRRIEQQQANAELVGLPLTEYLDLPRRERKRRLQRVRQANTKEANRG